MWHTQEGDRFLEGAEADMFRASISKMVEQIDLDIEINERWDYGAQLYDCLTHNQQLAMLAEVAAALLSKSVPVPELTAIREATVAAIYENIRQQVCIEIDFERSTPPAEAAECRHWRRLVLAAVRYWEMPATKISAMTDDEGPEEFFDESWQHDADWGFYIDLLANHILWDDGDWELEEEIADSSPEVSAGQKAFLGIAEGYFEAIAPDPKDSEISAIRESLGKLCTGNSEKDD